MTFVERILGAAAGMRVTVTPDIMVINDGVAYPAAEIAESVKYPEKVRVIFDHDVPTGRPEGSRVFAILRDFAKTNDLRFIQAQGVGYQYLLYQEVKPGQIILQGGSHAGIYGSVGALGISCGAELLADALQNGCCQITVPETIGVQVIGTLKDGVSVMDAAMKLLRDCPELPGKAVEFAAANLTAHEKAVLCSIACETGAFTAAVTDAEHAAFTLDLDTVAPMVTMPCANAASQKDAVRQPLSALEDTVFQAGQIGGYTGGTIEELRKAAAILDGQKLALGFRLSIVPATSADFLQAMNEGIITRFIDYGAQVLAVGDRSVVVQGAGVIDKGEKLLTTGLYTYSGCMGAEDGLVYTASVESVLKASMER